MDKNIGIFHILKISPTPIPQVHQIVSIQYHESVNLLTKLNQMANHQKV